MSWWKNLGETELHLAVLEDNIEKVKQASQDKTLLQSVNKWGFSPIELAQYLDKQEILSLITPKSEKKIKVYPKGKDELTICNKESFQNLFSIDYLSHIKFPDYQTLKRVCRKCPFLLKWTPLGNPYRDLTKRFATELHTGKVADVSIRWIDDILGYGVFAERDFTQKDFIGVYTGNIRRLYHHIPSQNAYCLQYPSVLPPIIAYVIDAEKQGNETRFLNHSDNPNLDMDLLLDKNLLHIGFFTNRPIKKGEQLTFNYGKDYWRDREKPIAI